MSLRYIMGAFALVLAACDTGAADRAREEARLRDEERLRETERENARLAASIRKIEQEMESARAMPVNPRPPPLEPDRRQIEALLSAAKASASARPPPKCKPCNANDPLCDCE
ncbi:MAG: hypothetical protein JNK04_08970 [Myxococcales bacterium]|nr:hypothetical protein [Myxococcales bacterium]